MRWLTSDHHWGHWRLNETYCRETRGFATVEEMNAQLIARWNESISPDDEVLLVGDVFVSRRMTLDEKVGILGMLNGRKTLIRGNHDDDLTPFQRAGFEKIVDHIWMETERVLIIHKGPDPQHARAELQLSQELNPLLVVHGHDHRHDVPDKPGCLNVCVDRWGLRPVPWTVVEEHLRTAHLITPDSPQQEG
jgi:calcineurin-like phosphoesterase family protein